MSPHRWKFRLYIAGKTPTAERAIENLDRICGEHLAHEYDLEIVDLRDEPGRAASDNIIAVPTLIRVLPEPLRKLIGDLSHTERVLEGLQLGMAT